ncbi:hypothetical protein CASP1_00011 [Alcaligenes phage CASP1]|nr:hypothetical protein CASP1_00011 [Alcaligenes phage CASP1]
MQKLTWDEFVSNVQKWAKERGIYEHSTTEAQLLKTLSELGELSDAVIKGDKDGLKDAIGDVMVCMVNYAYMEDMEFIHWEREQDSESDAQAIGFIAIDIGDMITELNCEYDIDNIPGCLIEIANRNGLDFLDCCSHAWHEIKDRKGRMVPGGAFVKDEA